MATTLVLLHMVDIVHLRPAGRCLELLCIFHHQRLALDAASAAALVAVLVAALVAALVSWSMALALALAFALALALALVFDLVTRFLSGMNKLVWWLPIDNMAHATS